MLNNIFEEYIMIVLYCIFLLNQEKMILAASNDNACRIWGMHDQRLKVCFIFKFSN